MSVFCMSSPLCLLLQSINALTLSLVWLSPLRASSSLKIVDSAHRFRYSHISLSEITACRTFSAPNRWLCSRIEPHSQHNCHIPDWLSTSISESWCFALSCSFGCQCAWCYSDFTSGSAELRKLSEALVWGVSLLEPGSYLQACNHRPSQRFPSICAFSSSSSSTSSSYGQGLVQKFQVETKGRHRLAFAMKSFSIFLWLLSCSHPSTRCFSDP